MGRTSGAVEEGAFGAWRAAGGRYVECSLAVLEQLRASAVDGLRALPRGGLEIGGVLFGIEKAGVVRITAQVPLPCEHALGPGFVLSANDRKALNNILAGTDPCLAGVRPVGWYRSQTRGDVPLTERDCELHDACFPEPWQVVLVLRPEPASRVRAAFFARTLEGGLAGGEEFEIAPVVRRKMERQPDLQVVPDCGPRPEAPAQAEALRPRQRDWRLVFTALAFLLIALGVAGFSYGRLTAPAGRLDFGLRAVDEKGKMLILWDRQAQPAVEAQKATIEIAEGGTRVSINLDRQGVRRGNASYIRQSGRVDLRMRIYRAHDDVEQRVTFLGEAPIRGAGL